MRLWTGPAGSGKTASVLDGFRQALRARRDDVRLLVPTATMVEHLQNRLAREGFVFRRSLVQTLNGFVEGRTRDLRQVSEAVLYLIVEEAARRVDRPEFARVAGLPGFCASLARTVAEFSSAGCDSARLASCLPEAPLAAAFQAVYREVDRELERRGLVLRARRLEIAAQRIEGEGLPGVATVWLDGFHALPDPELQVVGALARHADVTLAIGETDLDDRLQAMAVEVVRRGRSRPAPVVSVVRAPGIERECEEIARRILEQAAAGRPFREIGIVVRAADTYVPILASTLERFGIPGRFYFDAEMERHPTVRFLTGAVDAMLGGWDHQATLAALRLAPEFEDSNALDRFDFAVRERIPDVGLEALRGLTDSPAVLELMDRVAAVEEWRGLSLTPPDWALRVSAWGPFLQEALNEAAEALEGRGEIPLGEYWRAVKAVLRLQPLRVADGRRNVVNVLSAPEARQWVLPVVFVCGMVEKQFPQFHRQDPFFPDAARRSLNASGVRVRTAEQFEREERGLFDAAVSRGTLSVTLTYPEFDARGDRNLPSLFLESLAIPSEASRAARPLPRRQVCMRPGWAGSGPGLPAAGFLRERTARLSPTALESFLQCPFQYFGGRLLRLKPAPLRPEKRLDFLTQGNIVHEVLAAWWQAPGDIAALFEEVFARQARVKAIAISYQTERARHAMLGDLLKFAADGQWPRALYTSQMEQKFEFALDTVVIGGKIDRLDVGQDGRAFVIDYKYSNAQRTKARLENGNLLQAPLYLMAAERAFGLPPAGMFYVGIKGGVEYAEWQVSEGWEERTTERTLRVVEEIREGRIEVAPADPDNCRFCDSRDICRVESQQAAALAERA